MKQFAQKSKYRVSSTLPVADRPALESLFFLNENQSRLRESLFAAVGRYGAPQIVNSEGKIRLVLPRIENAQTLYIRTNELSPLLIGVVVYVREEKNLKILFWALRPDYTAQGKPGKYLLLEIVEILKDVGRRIVEIDHIAFEFGSREFTLRI